MKKNKKNNSLKFKKAFLPVIFFLMSLGLFSEVCLAEETNLFKLKRFMHMGGGISAELGGSNIGALRQLNQTAINNIQNSPFDSFALNVKSFGRDALRPFSDYTASINLAKNSGKYFWARINFFHNLYVCPEGTTGCNPDHILRLWDQSSLDYAFYWYRLGNQVSKANGAPGIFMDMESYNNYSNYRVTYLAEQNSKTKEEVILKLKEIGTQMADEANLAWGGQPMVVWIGGMDLYRTLNDGYGRATNIILEGMLDRIVEKNYPIVIVDAGAWTTGSTHISAEELRTKIADHFTKMKPYTDKYGSRLALGGYSILWLDYKSVVDWYYQNILSKYQDEEIETKTINDFEPLMKEMFNRYEYVLIYREGAAPQEYDEYAPAISEKFRPMLRSALCGNGVCEALHSEKADSCPVDCVAFSSSDLNQDGLINSSDIYILKADFLRLTANLANPRSDINTDGQCTVRDLGILMSGWK